MVVPKLYCRFADFCRSNAWCRGLRVKNYSPDSRLHCVADGNYCATDSIVPAITSCHRLLRATDYVAPQIILCHSLYCATDYIVPQIILYQRYCATDYIVPPIYCDTDYIVPPIILCHRLYCATDYIYFGEQTLASSSWRADSGEQALASRPWRADPGEQTLPSSSCRNPWCRLR